VRKIGNEEAVIVSRDTLKPYTLPSVASGIRNHRVCVDLDFRDVSHSLDKPEPLRLRFILVENETACQVNVVVFISADDALSLCQHCNQEL
jgi:hypothetical protein